MMGKWISPLRPVTRNEYGPPAGKSTPALFLPSQTMVWVPVPAVPVMTRLLVSPGSKFAPALITIWNDTVFTVVNWKVPPAPWVEVEPPTLPVKDTADSCGTGGVEGMPRKVNTLLTSAAFAPVGVMSLKKIGSCGRCAVTPAGKPESTNWLLPRISLYSDEPSSMKPPELAYSA